MKAPDPYRWTLNSCSGAFGNVWVHLGTFHYSMKLDAKLAELMFVQRSRGRIFGNKGIWSMPLNPKLMFWCVSYCLGAFDTILLLYETRCKSGWTSAINAKVRATKLHQKFFRTECTRSTPLNPKLISLVQLIVFVCIWQYFVTIQNSVQNGLHWCN